MNEKNLCNNDFYSHFYTSPNNSELIITNDEKTYFVNKNNKTMTLSKKRKFSSVDNEEDYTSLKLLYKKPKPLWYDNYIALNTNFNNIIKIIKLNDNIIKILIKVTNNMINFNNTNDVGCFKVFPCINKINFKNLPQKLKELSIENVGLDLKKKYFFNF